MYYVYILKSVIRERYYIGHTADYEKRLKDHNRGKVRSTKPYVPWKIVYLEEFNSKSEAFKREMQIKSYKNGEAFRRLIEK
ncbi:excinuclease abc c subunit domain protein [Melioribacter roseus P3M-2]|uniref:Excinuclease abc c subunit domain protein n=1 Tax=Melioribacter roseus (strain DSM 23840 / JCM 17771 / VKM B-2668 / P3M-2) TaxID=1191523 RepID=I7A6E5_MELRP|nr:GIY-YIG nuclease family protein [Melioribacter roseus]AFN75436.1 excinuclease abc c subunit domain protein [Melioribacter roseus P3M-2]